MSKDLKEVREGAMWPSAGRLLQKLRKARVETHLAYSRDSKEAYVAGMERIKRRAVGNEVKETIHGYIK